MKALTCFFIFSVATMGPVTALGECPVTLPSSSPVAPSASEKSGWYGSEALAVRLSPSGLWRGMGEEHNYGDKLWFWRRGFKAEYEPEPDLILEGEKLSTTDGPRRLLITDAKSAFTPTWDRMLVGMEFPSPGCWKLLATYRNAGIAHDLTFVVNVVDD